MSTNLSMLAEIPMFSLLDHNERRTLAELLREEQFRAGARIFEVGDQGDALYIVRHGSVQVLVENDSGESMVVAENGPGDVFGEISMLDGGPRTTTAIAMTDTDTLRLDRECLQELVATHPHAAIDVLTMVGRRLRSTDEMMRTRVSRNANVEEEEQMTFGERIADRVAAFGGSWTFILLFGVLLAAWMSYNEVVHRPFDPYPYILLNLVLSTLAAIQAPVIMMSQNRQAAKDRIKSDLDFEVNRKAELEIAHLHRKIDRIYNRIQERWAEQEKDRRRAERLDNKGPNEYY